MQDSKFLNICAKLWLNLQLSSVRFRQSSPRTKIVKIRKSFWTSNWRKGSGRNENTWRYFDSITVVSSDENVALTAWSNKIMTVQSFGHGSIEVTFGQGSKSG